MEQGVQCSEESSWFVLYTARAAKRWGPEKVVVAYGRGPSVISPSPATAAATARGIVEFQERGVEMLEPAPAITTGP
jgi:hypothetical protein